MSTLNRASKSLSKYFQGSAQAFTSKISEKMSPELKGTFYIRAFGFLKVPMLLFVSPSVVEINNERCVVKIPLNRRTKNHMNSMYFGVLAAGADCAGGLMGMTLIQEDGNRVVLSFKDFKADFLKRAEGDVHFTCSDGAVIRKVVQEAIETGERINQTIHVTATVPSKLGSEPVAEFDLTLSLKKKSK